MTDKKVRRPKKLSHEILAVLGASVVSTLFLFPLLTICATAIIEGYLAAREIVLTDAQLAALDGWVFNLAFLVTVIFFLILFLFLLGERLSYIQESLKGIEALHKGKMDYVVPIEGNNELTQLAEAINYLSATQREVKEKEQALNEEKEQFIRTLSHDIRTPLTSIMAYSGFLANMDNDSFKERKEYLELIQKKAEQIKDLTDILLDGGKRNPEYFENVMLLMNQLADEFEDSLQDYHMDIRVEGNANFAGLLDVQELQRIFDNLASNIQKYADAEQVASLAIHIGEHQIIIFQKNHIKMVDEPVQSYQMGLNSIRRIAHNYRGQVEVRQEEQVFEIQITLSAT